MSVGRGVWPSTVFHTYTAEGVLEVSVVVVVSGQEVSAATAEAKPAATMVFLSMILVWCWRKSLMKMDYVAEVKERQ